MAISKAGAVGLRKGFRSGLEEDVAGTLSKMGVPFAYEPKEDKVQYLQHQERVYTPDFVIKRKDGSKLIVETKGYFTAQDRVKHLMIQAQHPEKDIRFVFTRSKTKLSKTSKTTYGMWCEKHGFQYADKMIPVEWIIAPLDVPKKPKKRTDGCFSAGPEPLINS